MYILRQMQLEEWIKQVYPRFIDLYQIAMNCYSDEQKNKELGRIKSEVSPPIYLNVALEAGQWMEDTDWGWQLSIRTSQYKSLLFAALLSGTSQPPTCLGRCSGGRYKSISVYSRAPRLLPSASNINSQAQHHRNKQFYILLKKVFAVIFDLLLCFCDHLPSYSTFLWVF